MRKLLSVAVACVLIMTMFIPSVAVAAPDYSYVKVKLSSMGSPTSVQFKVAGAYRISESPTVDLFPGITYTIRTDGSGMKLTYSNGVATVSVSLGARATFVQYANGSSKNFLYINNPTIGWRYYSGDMAFIHPSGASYLQLVNTVFIETYLYGVIAYEMGNTWPIEALKAQAICARTYAMQHIKVNSGNTWHLVDTSADQVYRGFPFVDNNINTPMLNVISAVDATRGKALVSGDPALFNFASGQYSASNGGQIRYTATNDDFDLRNTSSPAFSYVFPKSTDADTMNALSTSDRAKANTMLALLKEMAPAALKAQGVNCAAGDVTISGIISAVPMSPRSNLPAGPGMPQGSKEFTKVEVILNVFVNNALAPRAEVKGKDGLIIADNDELPSTTDDTDFGSANANDGSSVEKTYTIHNVGNAALNITGITLTGVNTGDFSIGSGIPTTIAASSSATFTVKFDPADIGVRSATVNIACNDTNTNPYTFNIQGTGAGQSGQCAITTFGFLGLEPDVTGNITGINIALTVPAATDITNLVPTFAVSAGATVKVGGTDQVSGVTAQDFTLPVSYTVMAQNGVATSIYIVTVTKTALSLQSPAAASAPSGGGGMPVGSTFQTKIILDYIKLGASGKYDVLGDMRTRFTTYSSLIGGANNYWLLHSGVSADNKCLLVTARGYGHGKGLSQRGAQQMANELKPGTTEKHTYTDIIGFYYSTYAMADIGIAQKTLSQIPGNSSGVQYGKVTAATLNVRAAANGTVLATLPRNTIVEILSTTTSWHKILQGSTGLIGYVARGTGYIVTTTIAPTGTPSPSVSTSASTTPAGSATSTPVPTTTPTPITGRVLATEINMRAQLNTTSAILWKLKKGDVVIIVDANVAANWYKVRYLSYVGYCMYQSGLTQYIEVIGAAPAPTPTGTGTVNPGALQPVMATTYNVDTFLTLRGTAAGTKIGEIPRGASFKVLKVDTNKDWLYVYYAAINKSGYVNSAYVKVGSSTAYKACTVISSSTLNVRSNPSTGSSGTIIGTLKRDDTVIWMATVSAEGKSWYKIQFGAVQAYIDGSYARKAN